jgi:cation diffusion facilitator family transporter
VATIVLKSIACIITGAIGLLADAAESLVNLAGALMALWMLRIANLPADEEHEYGHSKAEYFASGFEGSLILLAAGAIAIAAIVRWIEPRPIEQLGLGLAVTLVASLLNLVAALMILAGARHHRSITLEANARHLLTDVWTSIGVIVGLAAVNFTGWWRLDPTIAMLVAAHLATTGYQLIKRSVLGLLDTALPEPEQQRLQAAIAAHLTHGVQMHALRTRQSGARSFVSFHILVPGEWTVQRGHELLECIEADVRRALPNVTVFTHLEPLDDPAAWADTGLDRPA